MIESIIGIAVGVAVVIAAVAFLFGALKKATGYNQRERIIELLEGQNRPEYYDDDDEIR